MARIRTIKPEFWSDERIVELDFWIRLLFVGLWNFADDEGRMVRSEKRIKMQIFPGDSPNIQGGLNELSRAGLIECYVIDGVEYLHIPTFLKHQRVDHPSKSKIPPPPSKKTGASSNARRTLAPEGKGREGNKPLETTPASGVRTTPPPAKPPAGVVPADAGQATPVGAAAARSLEALRVAPAMDTPQHERAGELWAVLTANGCRGTAAHPAVVEMARAGVTVEQLRTAILEARKSNDGPLNPAYLAAIVERMRASPAKASQGWKTDDAKAEELCRELGIRGAKIGEDREAWHTRIGHALTERARSQVA